jgi:hypothetical protein
MDRTVTPTEWIILNHIRDFSAGKSVIRVARDAIATGDDAVAARAVASMIKKNWLQERRGKGWELTDSARRMIA